VRKGYETPEPLAAAPLLLLIVWYGLISTCAWLGYSLGVRLPTPEPVLDGPDDMRTYLAFSTIAAFATAAVYYQLYENGILLKYILNYSAMSANVLRDSLYEDYHIGVFSLRYVVSISGGIAAYRMITRGKVALIDAVNVLCLLLISALSSRLTMMLAAFVVIGMFAADRNGLTRAAKMRMTAGLLMFLSMIWIYNYSRNSSFYSVRHNDGFFLAGVSEIVAYLGGPLNVAIGVGNHWSLALNGQEASEFVDYDFEHLTTNSVLADLVPVMGWLSFPFIALESLAYGVLSGWCSVQKRSPVFIACPLIAYGFFELWRVNILGRGIMCCLIVCALFIPLTVGRFLPRRKLTGRFGPRPVLPVNRSSVFH
jgi:hypothetical protein